MNLIFSLMVTVTIAIACEDEITSKINIFVTNNQNAPVPNATILVNDTIIGKTDSKGYYLYNAKGHPGNAFRIEILKESTTHYYAPYFDKIVISPKLPQKVKIKAILYSVPKPNKENISQTTSTRPLDDLPDIEDKQEVKPEINIEDRPDPIQDKEQELIAKSKIIVKHKKEIVQLQKKKV